MKARRIPTALTLVLTLAGSIVGSAQESTTTSYVVTGSVFEDLDANGRRDEGEPGVAGVRVSDQVVVTSSQQDGSFRLPDPAGYGLVSISQPDGYRVNGPFWRQINEESAATDLQFPLIKTGTLSDFTFIHASDTHLFEETLPRTRRLREIVTAENPSFVLLTGDLIEDALRVTEEVAVGQYELLVRELRQFPVPVWTALGNHEIFGIERHRSLVSPDHPLYGKKMYRHFLGPNYYSFDFGGVRFVSLDTVGVADLWYHGFVGAVQLAWLQQDLADLDPGKPVVTFNHLPLVTAGANIFGYAQDEAVPLFLTINGEPRYRHVVGNTSDVLAVLRPHQYSLALAGHFHTREKLFFETDGVQTRFHLASAVKGDYGNAMGMRMMSGVTLYRVSNGEIDDGTFISLD